MGKVNITIFMLLVGIILILFATSSKGWSVWQIIKGKTPTGSNMASNGEKLPKDVKEKQKTTGEFLPVG